MVDLGTLGHTQSLYNLSYLRLYTCYRLDLGFDSNMCQVEDLRKFKIRHLTLMVDLENKGQTHLCMTFCISGCEHHTCRHDLCIDSKNFENWDVENVEIIYVSQTFNLETRGHTHFSYDLAYLLLYASY